MKNVISEFILLDMLIKYVTDENNMTGLEILPLSHQTQANAKKSSVDSLIHAFVRGDHFSGGFANGHTMRNSQTTLSFKYDSQLVERDGNKLQITTILKNESDQIAKHLLSYQYDTKAFKIKTIFRNESNCEITLEMLSSFSLGGITSFVEGKAADSLMVYSIKSCWSSEGRLVSSTIEDLQLEPSWSGYGVRTLKFGQIGSMPVRKYFPFIAVEDTENNMIWAAQIACASSWQIELYRRDDALCISGGLADFDFGHWAKFLLPGEEIETPEAIVTVGVGDIDEVSQRLISVQERSFALSQNLPVLFNEFCTTWGAPSHDNIINILECIRSKPIQYFVIDAGWYANKSGDWGQNGDWEISQELFPNGLEATVELIRKSGMIPGIWFEFEDCANTSKVSSMKEHLLKRNGYVIQSGSKCFFDMRDVWVDQYLNEKVIDMLKKYRFKYIKIDYNDSIGVGCDGAESLGEGLRQNILATQAFIRKIRREIPDIVIEICSSGGHRLEPSMLSLCDMESFSDAHECNEIPIIAASLHRIVQPGKLQIWAVLRKEDSLLRVVYSLTSTFLGVMCLSGDIFDLNSEQWNLVDRGISFYHSVSHIISNGISRFFGTRIGSYRSPKGWQCIVRYSENRNEALAIFHSFGGDQPNQIEIPLENEFEVKNVYSVTGNVCVKNSILIVPAGLNFEATAIYIVRKT